MNFPILSTLIFLPLISSFFILLSKSKTSNSSSIYISLFSSLATFFLSLFLWYSLDTNISEFQFIEEPCNPCKALDFPYDTSCPFSIKPDKKVSPAWETIWGLPETPIPDLPKNFPFWEN